MPKPNVAAMRQSLRAHILADAIARGIRWVLWLALVLGIVAPLVVAAWQEVGALSALIIAGLLLGCCAHVMPQGRSVGARVREIAREYPDD